jgi:hypothetical protein
VPIQVRAVTGNFRCDLQLVRQDNDLTLLKLGQQFFYLGISCLNRPRKDRVRSLVVLERTISGDVGKLSRYRTSTNSTALLEGSSEGKTFKNIDEEKQQVS